VTSDRNTRGTRPLSPTFAHFLAPAITATLVPLVMEYVVRPRLADTVTLSGDRLAVGLAVVALASVVVVLVLDLVIRLVLQRRVDRYEGQQAHRDR